MARRSSNGDHLLSSRSSWTAPAKCAARNGSKESGWVPIWPVDATGTASPDTLTVYHHVGCKASGPKASQARAWGLASITAKVTGRSRHWPRRRAVSPQILKNRNHHARSSARRPCDTPCEWSGICESWGRSELPPRRFCQMLLTCRSVAGSCAWQAIDQVCEPSWHILGATGVRSMRSR